MMLKGLKSLFVVEEETKPNKTAKTPASGVDKKKPANKGTTPTAPSTAKSVSNSGNKGKVTSKFMDTLLGAMEEANLEGFDYLEYKKSMQSLKKMSMDSATMYQSAFAMAQTMGATPAQLVESAQHYVDVLTKEEKKFEAALAHQQQTKIGSKQQEKKDLQAAIKNNEAQIKKLQESSKKHEQKLQGLDSEIQTAMSRVESTKNNFIVTYQQLVGQISTDINNMKKYLK